MPWNIPTQPISLVIAAPAAKAQALYSALAGDNRFTVAALATSPAEVTARLALSPQALLLDGLLYDGPDEILTALAGYGGRCLLLLPAGVDPVAVADLEALPVVARVVQGDVDAPTLAAFLLESIGASTMVTASGGLPLPLPPRPVTVSGWRAIAVWSLQGGVGKSTLAAALALEAAARRLPTLLVGLGAPDPLPLSLGLRPEPTLAHWRSLPTAEGLQKAVQSLAGLDLLAGFASPLELADYAPHALTGEQSLSHLTAIAAHAGYGVVVLDVSAPELAPAALAAANTLLLVGAPTLPGILSLVEGVRLAAEHLEPRHRLPASAIHLVLNRVRATTFTPEEVVQNGSRLLKGFPPLAAAIVDDPAIDESLNLRRPAYYHSDSLRQGVRTLANLLFAPAHTEVAAAPGKVYTLGPLRVRV